MRLACFFRARQGQILARARHADAGRERKPRPSRAAPQVSGPLMGALQLSYRKFDWKQFDFFFPGACYAGTGRLPGAANVSHFPLCGFDGKCAVDQVDPREKECCDAENACDFSRNECTSGRACVLSFLYNAAAPVASVSFFAIVLEITGLTLACIVRPVVGRLEFPDRNRDRWTLKDDHEMEEV